LQNCGTKDLRIANKYNLYSAEKSAGKSAILPVEVAGCLFEAQVVFPKKASRVRVFHPQYKKRYRT